MHFPTEPPAGKGMSEFMQRLDYNQAQIEPEQVAGSKNPLALACEATEIIHCNFQGISHNPKPEKQSRPTD